MPSTSPPFRSAKNRGLARTCRAGIGPPRSPRSAQGVQVRLTSGDEPVPRLRSSSSPQWGSSTRNSGRVFPFPGILSSEARPCESPTWRARCRCSADSGAIGTVSLLPRSAAAGERLSVTDSRVTEDDFPAGQRAGFGLARITPPSPPHPRSPPAGGPREHPADSPARAHSASSGCSSRGAARPPGPGSTSSSRQCYGRGLDRPSDRSRPGLPGRRGDGRLRPREGSSPPRPAPSTPMGGAARSCPRRPRPRFLLRLTAGRTRGEQAASSPALAESVEEGNPLG